MISHTTLRYLANLRKADRPSLQLPLVCASLFCIAFGIALILNVQMASDGWWHWYARLFRSGQSLYGDLHYNLQPLFVLETALFQTLFGESWLATRIPALLHLVLFVAGFHLVIARVPDFSGGDKAILLLSVFAVAIHFELYRFDDYHVVSNICYLFSLAILTRASPLDSHRDKHVPLALALGCLSAMALLTRINDGGMLLLCSATILYLGAGGNPRRRLLLASYFLAFAVTVAVILAMTGDSIATYLRQSVFEAATIKGTPWDLLWRPILLLHKAAGTVTGLFNWMTIVIVLGFALSLQSLFNEPPTQAAALGWRRVLALAVLIATMSALYSPIDEGRIISIVGGMVVLVVYARVLILLEAASLCPASVASKPNAVAPYLLLIPFGYYVAGSMSSGGSHLSLTVPMAMSIPILLKSVRMTRKWKFVALTVLGLTGISALLLKASNPANWHGFRSPPLLMERTLADHPLHGPMVIEEKLRALGDDTCAAIGPGNPSLLSLPFPYFNYYCGIAPWKGYVQTFFDTSSRRTIDALIADLESGPPDFVMFQEQELNLRNHEVMYNNGHPIPHRGLHEFIKRKIAEGAWTVLRESKYGNNYTWFLISTKARQ